MLMLKIKSKLMAGNISTLYYLGKKCANEKNIGDW